MVSYTQGGTAMKIRSVIKSGNCLVVTIPAEFVKAEDLGKGSELRYKIIGHELTFTPVNVSEVTAEPKIFG